MLLTESSVLRRVTLGVWLVAVAEYSLTAGWLISALSASLPVAILTGLAVAFFGAGLPLLAVTLRRRQV